MIKGLFADGIFRRILKNFSWLLIGQIFTAIANLGYLSLTTHTLGLERFGLFMVARAFIEMQAEKLNSRKNKIFIEVYSEGELVDKTKTSFLGPIK